MAKRGLMAATAISMLILTYSTSNAAMAETPPSEPTAREKGCAVSQAWMTCAPAAETCFYKYKVVGVNKADQQDLSVRYPPSVWEQTKKSMRNMAAEAKYREQYDNEFHIRIKKGGESESRAEAGKIYLFTRCTGKGDGDNDFTLGEVQPDEIAERGGPQQSAQ